MKSARQVAVLMVDIGPWSIATRPRKIVGSLPEGLSVCYLSPASAGRAARRDPAGTRQNGWTRVEHVPIGRLRDVRGLTSMAVNGGKYLLSLSRLYVRALRTPADLIIAEDRSLLPLLALHRSRYQSRLMYDVRERVGLVRASLSFSAWISRFERPLLRRWIRRIDLLTTVSTTHAQELAELGAEQVTVLMNAPDWPASDTIELRRSGEPLVVALVGTLTPDRGAAVLCEAVTKVPDVNLFIAGDGPIEELERIRRFAAECTRIKYLGGVDYDGVRAIYECSHVTAVLYDSSDPANDSMPNKLFEAMACGTALLQAEQPLARAFIEEMGIGLVCDLSPDSLAEKLAEFRLNEGARAQMAERGLELYRTRYRWSLQTARFRRKVVALVGERTDENR